MDRLHMDEAVRHMASLRSRIAGEKTFGSTSRARWSRIGQRLVSADDVLQEAVLALAKNISTHGGGVTRKMIRWAVGRGWHNAGRAAWPIDVSEERGKDVAFTTARKQTVTRRAAWHDVEEIEESIAGRDRDPADAAEDRDLIVVLARKAEPEDFARVVRSDVRDVSIANDALVRGVSKQAEHEAVCKARQRVAASLRRAA